MPEMELEITLRPIVEEDLPDITLVMTRAFDDDAQKHLGQARGGPPGYDTGDFFREWLFKYEESVGFRIDVDAQLVGAIVVWILPEGHNILGTIFIDPAFQDRGLGAKTWARIEQKYPETKSWRLGTPTWATKNHHFYQKCGFCEVASDPLIPPEEGLTIYHKEMQKTKP